MHALRPSQAFSELIIINSFIIIMTKWPPGHLQCYTLKSTMTHNGT